MTRVFYRDMREKPPVAARGEGIHIVDDAGNRYIDASGGAAVSTLGHSDPDVRRAILDQVGSLAYAHTAFFTTRAQEDLADLLVEASPSGLDRVYFVSGGSEAMDTALKLARQYFVDTRRRPPIPRDEERNADLDGTHRPRPLAGGGHLPRYVAP